MADLQTQVANIALHPQADQLAREYIANFTDSLNLESKTLAVIEKADIVLSTHVIEARRIIIKQQKRDWKKELLIILGGALLGAFFPGFTTELNSATPNKNLLVAYTGMGFVGMVLIFLGIRR